MLAGVPAHLGHGGEEVDGDMLELRSPTGPGMGLRDDLPLRASLQLPGAANHSNEGLPKAGKAAGGDESPHPVLPPPPVMKGEELHVIGEHFRWVGRLRLAWGHREVIWEM